MDDGGHLIRECSTRDGDARLGETHRAAASPHAGIRYGEVHARHPGGDKRVDAGAGHARVVAGFEGDDRGQSARVGKVGEGIHFGVGRSHAAVPALRDDGAALVDEHAADLRVRTDGGTPERELKCAPHGRLECCCLSHPVLIF